MSNAAALMALILSSRETLREARVRFDEVSEEFETCGQQAASLMLARWGVTGRDAIVVLQAIRSN